jgi:photoactive yellow protein
MIPAFEAADLASQVEALSDAERDALPYGAIKLDVKGVVCAYNQTEARLSGRKSRPTVGLSFFADVAPCMASPDMRGRIDDAARRGAVDIEIGWIGDFDDPDGEIQIRVLSASDGGLWLFMNRAEH